MKYQPFAFWLFALVVGILISDYTAINPVWILAIGILSFALFAFDLFIKHNKYLPAIFGFIIITCLGSLRFYQSNPDRQSIEIEAEQLYYIQIDKLLKPSAKYDKYFANILNTENSYSNSDDRILVYIRKGNESIHQDDRLWIQGKLQDISSSKNPHAFDYKNYMAKKRIYQQIFSDTLVSLTHADTWQHRLSRFKQDTKKKLDERDFSKSSKIFISSLALGDRSSLDRDFQETLSSAGVMHLFAISGLHVAIVFGFILLVLYPLLYFPHGKILRWMVALCVIWLFAWFVDFTSSVTRAVFMISIYYVTLMLQRTSNIYHTLSLTAFVLLLIDPNELFQVGFQLSYSAVFFIAWLYQPIRRLLPHFRKPYKNIVFDIMTISTTAQFGVMPITVFYFHKFSFLYLIGNLVIIPFAGLMVITSIITAFAIHSEYLPNFWVIGINYAFEWIYIFLNYLTSYESLIFENISWTIPQVFLLITLLLSLRPVILKFKWRKLIPILTILLLFQFTRLWNAYQFQSKNEFIVFQEYKGTVIGLRQGDRMDVFWNVEDSINVMNYTITPYVLNENIQQVNFRKIDDTLQYKMFVKQNSFMKFSDQKFFIATENTTQVPKNYSLIITSSPKKLIIDSIVNKNRIIADGSNYPYLINNLRKKSLKVYSTAEEGAYLETIK